MEAWNIKQLYEALQTSLTLCNNAFERGMCNAIAGKEIRDKASLWAKSRKLTPVEISIAQQFGYKG